jgi:MFS family permease
MMGVNVALMLSIGNAVVIKLTKRDRVAVAISTFNIFVDLAYVIGPIVIGMLIDDMGYRDSYMAMAAVATISLILYYVLHGRLVTAGKIPKGSF